MGYVRGVLGEGPRRKVRGRALWSGAMALLHPPLGATSTSCDLAYVGGTSRWVTILHFAHHWVGVVFDLFGVAPQAPIDIKFGDG